MKRNRSGTKRRKRSGIPLCPKRTTASTRALLRQSSTFPCRKERTIFASPEEYADYYALVTEKRVNELRTYSPKQRKSVIKKYNDALQKEKEETELEIEIEIENSPKIKRKR